MFANPTFRAQFPEFTDPGTYPDALITAWATIALTRLDQLRWNDLWDYGVSLMVAHYMSLARTAAIAARSGAAPGAVTGVVSSKSVGPVSVSFDIAAITMPEAGQWNLTRYGIELFQLMGQVGAGGVQVAGTICGDGGNGGYPFGYFAG